MSSSPDLQTFYFCPYCQQNYPKTDLNRECTRVLFLTSAANHIQICWRCNHSIPAYHICDCIVTAIRDTQETASTAEYYSCQTCSEHVAIDQRGMHEHDTWALRSSLALHPAEVQIALVPEQMSSSIPHPSSLSHIADSVDNLPSVPPRPVREAKTPPPSFPNNTDGPQMEHRWSHQLQISIPTTSILMARCFLSSLRRLFQSQLILEDILSQNLLRDHEMRRWFRHGFTAIHERCLPKICYFELSRRVKAEGFR